MVAESCEQLKAETDRLPDPLSRIHFYIEAAVSALTDDRRGATRQLMTAEHFRLYPMFPDEMADGNRPFNELRCRKSPPRTPLATVRHDGIDAGELCGEGSVGVAATSDRDAILKLEADCCVYMARATGSGQTRAGLTQDELVDDMVALLESGTNVVTTCTDLIARGVRLSERNRARLLDACSRGNASVWASGSDPGFVTETLPLAFLSIQRRIDLIEIEEFGDLSHTPSAHMVMQQMRFGKALAEFDPEWRKNHLFGEYQPALMVLADLAGFDIAKWTTEGGVAAAKEDLEIVAGTIEAGTAAAQRIMVTGCSRGEDRVHFTHYGFVAMDMEPDWDSSPRDGASACTETLPSTPHAGPGAARRVRILCACVQYRRPGQRRPLRLRGPARPGPAS